MNVNLKLKVLTVGVMFFTGHLLIAQKTERNQKSEKEKETEIKEVVVVGYSTVKKEDYVGTAATVNTKSIKSKNVTNVGQALAGESSGVRVIMGSGQPGSAPVVRIRGFSSVNGGREPLYVVDGIPYTGTLAAINPEDIESTVILKDATATAIYGSRGSNGVILINTKKGKSNRQQITLESKSGFNFQLIPRYDVISSPEEYIETSWNAMYNRGKLTGQDAADFANKNLFNRLGISQHYNMWEGSPENLIDPTTGKVRDGVKRLYSPENWRDYAFKTAAVRTENNLSISGGSGKTTYYTGIGYLNDDGYSINTGYERYSTRLNLSHQARPWLKGDFNIGYSYSKSKNNGQERNSRNIFNFSDNIPSIYPVFLRQGGQFVPDIYYGGNQYDYGEDGRGFQPFSNAIADAIYNRDHREHNEINLNLFLKANIIRGLSFESRFGGQYRNSRFSDYDNPYYGSARSQKGFISKELRERMSYSFLQLLRYNKTFDRHNLETFIAHEANSFEENRLSASKHGLVIPHGTEFNNAINQNPASSYVLDDTLESYFGQLSYDFGKKYYLSASIRTDGSSRFLNNKWDSFYSVGLGWMVSREHFLKENDFIKNLKLKTSYGTTGNRSGVDFYSGYPVYTAGNFMSLHAASFVRTGYPNLTWEKSRILQGGIDLTLFKNRLFDITVDYYHKTTDQLLFDNRLSPATGNAIMKVNDGLLVNQGIEFNVQGHIINKGDFYLDLSVNGEILKNRLTQMPIDFSNNKRKIIDISGVFGRSAGRSIFDYYMREYRGVDPQTGEAMWTMYYHDVDPEDGDGFKEGVDKKIASLHEFQSDVANREAVVKEMTTKVYDQATQKYLNKTAIPDIRGAFRLNTGYKGFSVSAQMLYGIGGYAYDNAYAQLMRNGKIGSNNWHVDIRNRWKNPGDITDIPRLSSEYVSRDGTVNDTNFSSLSSRFLIKSNYLVLNNLRISYDLPREFYEKMQIQGLSLSISGDNLWISTKRRGFNPSTSETGITDVYSYSPLSTVTFGVRANF